MPLGLTLRLIQTDHTTAISSSLPLTELLQDVVVGVELEVEAAMQSEALVPVLDHGGQALPPLKGKRRKERQKA